MCAPQLEDVECCPWKGYYVTLAMTQFSTRVAIPWEGARALSLVPAVPLACTSNGRRFIANTSVTAAHYVSVALRPSAMSAGLVSRGTITVTVAGYSVAALVATLGAPSTPLANSTAYVVCVNMMDSSCSESIAVPAGTWFVYEAYLFSMLGTVFPFGIDVALTVCPVSSAGAHNEMLFDRYCVLGPCGCARLVDFWGLWAPAIDVLIHVCVDTGASRSIGVKKLVSMPASTLTCGPSPAAWVGGSCSLSGSSSFAAGTAAYIDADVGAGAVAGTFGVFVARTDGPARLRTMSLFARSTLDEGWVAVVEAPSLVSGWNMFPLPITSSLRVRARARGG